MPDTHPELKHKTLGVQGVKVLDEGEGIVEAYVAGIGNKDSVGDIIRPGAFVDSLKQRTPKGVWSHNWDLPVAKTIEAREVGAGGSELPVKMKTAGIGGLYVKAQFNLNTQRGRDAYEDVKFFGDEAEWSIGYREVETEWNKDAQANDLLKVELYEYSPVLFGANSLTATVGVKSEAGDVKIEGVPPHMAKQVGAAVADLLKKDGADAAEIEVEATKKLHDYKGDGGPCEICDAARNDAEQHYGADGDSDKGGQGGGEGGSTKQAVPGSLEARQDALAEAVQATGDASWAYPVATFDSTVVVQYEQDIDNGDGTWSFETGYWQYSYSYDAASGEATLGDRSDVDLVATVVGKGAGEAVDLAFGEILDAGAIEDDGTFTLLTDPFEQANKIGRVLSQANYDKLTGALDAIQGVLQQATVVDDSVDGELSADRPKFTKVSAEKLAEWRKAAKAVGTAAYAAAIAAAAAAGTEPEGVDLDEVPVALAQAVDAVLDEVSEALAGGDTAGATDLLVAAETTIDQLIEVLGGVDSDDVDTLSADDDTETKDEPEAIVLDMDAFKADLAAAAAVAGE